MTDQEKLAKLADKITRHLMETFRFDHAHYYQTIAWEIIKFLDREGNLKWDYKILNTISKPG